ncbi:ATP-binding protein [Helicovermis profundi]|uniref:ATP-binding protein n=1 Tax=Helicovermis profundi TaxID=3065157 RepID=A0AAU9EP52_9FIRM|nr:ATP-binding protein [Clostridia bacterium S502]
MFIGRDYEINKLYKLYNENKFECIVMYGRRRVGKTRLITEFCRGKNTIFYVGEEHNDKLSLKKFSIQIMEHYNLNEFTPEFESFDTAFRFIGEKAKTKRTILVLDEFPYMVSSNKSILSILQNNIDHHLINTKLFLIICGSSISFMENEVLSHKSPLFGRRTAQFMISPLDFFDSIKFFKNYSNEDKMKSYSVLGGVPQYLLQFDSNKSFDYNMINKLYDKSSYLYMEVELLLKQELVNPIVYKSIIEAIADGSSKLNEISTKIGETTSKTSIYIKSLLELKIIQKLVPITEKSNSRKTLYNICDNFYSFYYKYVAKYISAIEQEMGEYIYIEKVNHKFYEHQGYVFEEICKDYLSRKNKKSELPFIIFKLGKWWGNNPIKKKQEEIDIVGFGEDKTLFAECKYTNEKVGISIYEKLVERSNLINSKDSYYYIFSKNGFNESLLKLEKNINNLTLVTLDIMIKEFE